MTDSRQVIVVGGGNAALCAAISAAECGARVTLLERAPCDLRGGNSRFTAGAMRVEGKQYCVQDGDVIYFRFNV